MNSGPMNGTDELERRIRERLHGHSRLAPDGDGWEGILDRIEQRGRARHRRRAAATGLAVVGMVGSLAVLAGDDDASVSTTPAGPNARAAAVAPDGRLPRLVFQVPGFDLVGAFSSAPTGPETDIGPLLVYGSPGDGLLGPGPVVFARLVPAGAAYGIGEGPAVTVVEVGRRRAHLIGTGGAARSLGWAREDGSIVHLVAMGVGDADLLAMGQTVEEALAGAQDPPAVLPGDIQLRRTSRPDPSSGAEAEVVYGSEGRSADLRLTAGGAYRLDSLVLDRLASSADWRPSTVGGRPAVLSTYAQLGEGGPSRTLMWAVRDGVVAELRSEGLSEAELEAAAATIHEVDEAEWGAMVARFDDPPGGPDQAPTDDALGTVTTEMCQARNWWLRAHEVGDGAGERAARAQLGAVLEKGRAEGLGDTGDVLLVMEGLLDAMAGGDEATVSSTPAGGACS
jgi:hypothetical protein